MTENNLGRKEYIGLQFQGSKNLSRQGVMAVSGRHGSRSGKLRDCILKCEYEAERESKPGVRKVYEMLKSSFECCTSSSTITPPPPPKGATNWDQVFKYQTYAVRSHSNHYRNLHLCQMCLHVTCIMHSYYIFTLVTGMAHWYNCFIALLWQLCASAHGRERLFL